MENLSYLNLYGTQVTDAAIDDIAAIQGLAKVFIWQSQITIDGVAALKEKRPELKIIPDLVADKARAEADAIRKIEDAEAALVAATTAAEEATAAKAAADKAAADDADNADLKKAAEAAGTAATAAEKARADAQKALEDLKNPPPPAEEKKEGE
jgi:PleD family two-component response regulator